MTFMSLYDMKLLDSIAKESQRIKLSSTGNFHSFLLSLEEIVVQS